MLLNKFKKYLFNNILFVFRIILWYYSSTTYILSSSVVEQSAVNRLAVGSNPTWGDFKNIKNINGKF